MAEEQRIQSPEDHRLCANNCGFFGNPATLNLCSKCYRDFRLKQQQQQLSPSSATATNAAVESTVDKTPSSAAAASFSASFASPPQNVTGDGGESATVMPAEPTARKSNRCSVCRRRVGLTGFMCKCGTMFCGSHRYPEQHGCTFDFKGVEREAIAKANPVVKAEKLDKV